MDTQTRMRKYLNNLRYTCKSKIDRNGNKVEMLLDMDSLSTLLTEAGITIWDVGRGHHKYCLARVNDLGHYEVGNARFMTHQENHEEFWNNLTEEEREAHKERGRVNGHLGAEYGHLGGYPNSRTA